MRDSIYLMPCFRESAIIIITRLHSPSFYSNRCYRWRAGVSSPLKVASRNTSLLQSHFVKVTPITSRRDDQPLGNLKLMPFVPAKWLLHCLSCGLPVGDPTLLVCGKQNCIRFLLVRSHAVILQSADRFCNRAYRRRRDY